jgi:hypothetical protein
VHYGSCYSDVGKFQGCEEAFRDEWWGSEYKQSVRKHSVTLKAHAFPCSGSPKVVVACLQ